MEQKPSVGRIVVYHNPGSKDGTYSANTVPGMEKIAKCELGGTHYRQDGTLVKNLIKNEVLDFGKFQINSAWEAKAASMGYNIYLPEGNEDFAYWLYNTRGTEDWYSSKHCWSK